MSAGKGSKPRPVDLKTFEANYEKIFSHRKTILDWQKHFGHVIKSYDGFRQYTKEDLLTQEEYESGYVRCTVLHSRPCVLKNIVTDGFGNIWQKCNKPECDLHVVRPGKVQCSCENE